MPSIVLGHLALPLLVRGAIEILPGGIASLLERLLGRGTCSAGTLPHLSLILLRTCVVDILLDRGIGLKFAAPVRPVICSAVVSVRKLLICFTRGTKHGRVAGSRFVRVVYDGQGAESCFDGVVAGSELQAKHGIVVLEGFLVHGAEVLH